MDSAVIIAGGRGTRLGPATSNLPKPLVDVCGVPFLHHLIKQVEGAGISRLIILAGYLGHEFTNFVNRYKVDFPGLDIVVKISEVDLNTGDRLLDAFDILDDRFLFLYGDNYAPINLRCYLNDARENADSRYLLAYENSDSYSKSNISIDEQNNILSYGSHNKQSQKCGHVDVGYTVLNKNDLHKISLRKNVHFGRDILKSLIDQCQVKAKVLLSRYYTVGTMERLQAARLFFSYEKFVFIDRDGVLNVKSPRGTYVEKASDFIWKKGSLEGLKIFKDNGYRVIVITNQAGVGRGVFDMNDLEDIHQKMCLDARNAGGEIEYIYCCPHHWEDDCDCRKPKPGMLINAQKDLMIDLSRTTFIGDDDRDGIAALAAGTQFIKVNSNNSLKEIAGRMLADLNSKENT